MNYTFLFTKLMLEITADCAMIDPPKKHALNFALDMPARCFLEEVQVLCNSDKVLTGRKM